LANTERPIDLHQLLAHPWPRLVHDITRSEDGQLDGTELQPREDGFTFSPYRMLVTMGRAVGADDRA
jgi:hypothetical protein